MVYMVRSLMDGLGVLLHPISVRPGQMVGTF